MLQSNNFWIKPNNLNTFFNLFKYIDFGLCLWISMNLNVFTFFYFPLAIVYLPSTNRVSIYFLKLLKHAQLEPCKIPDDIFQAFICFHWQILEKIHHFWVLYSHQDFVNWPIAFLIVLNYFKNHFIFFCNLNQPGLLVSFFDKIMILIKFKIHQF